MVLNSDNGPWRTIFLGETTIHGGDNSANNDILFILQFSRQHSDQRRIRLRS